MLRLASRPAGRSPPPAASGYALTTANTEERIAPKLSTTGENFMANFAGFSSLRQGLLGRGLR